MSTSTANVRAQHVAISNETLIVDLNDGRSISIPLAWYPRLLSASPKQRQNWRLVGENEGINWPDLDEDISVENLLMGKRSGESKDSFEKWQKNRTTVPHDTV